LKEWPNERRCNPNTAYDARSRWHAFFGWRSELTEIESEVVLRALYESEVRIHANFEFRRELHLDLLT